jgi:CheY-like chemotaxis protein
MKIDYNILWLDDNITAFEEDGWINKIKQYLSDEGFEPKIKAVARVDEFYANLNESFDLILTDYHMAVKKGDEIVKDIREKNILTEILFYTAKADLQEIGNIDRITFLETSGDHHSEVIEEMKELIGLTIKKFQHIIAMRGMLMHETSALDSQTKQILLTYMSSKKADNLIIIDSICQKLDELLSKKQEIVKRVKNSKKYKDLVKDTFLFSTEYKIEAIKFVLEKLSLPDFTDSYKNEVSNFRNKFAHAVLEKDDNGKQYFKSGEDGIAFDEHLCRTLRKDINKHKKNIDELENKLKEFIKE